MAVSANTLQPQLNVISLRMNGVLSYLDPVCSPGWRRKKYENNIMLHFAWRTGLLDALEKLEICQKTLRGSNLLSLVAGTDFCSTGTGSRVGFPVPLGL